MEIRQYGEARGNSFDWLGLGERVTNSPAGPTHESGKWRVRAAQVIGALNISRIKNEMFEDKSSREGIRENDSFTAFKNIVIAIISVFEDDRQAIMRALDSLHNETDSRRQKIKEADKVLDLIKSSSQNLELEKPEKSKILIDAYVAQKSQIQELIDENKLLVGLASTGLTVSSFSHELKQILKQIYY